MVTANINDNKVRLPERFTIEEWLELQRWDFANPTHWPHVLETITKLDKETFVNANEESLQLFMGFIIASVNRRQVLELPDFNTINFGQFVDLDCFISLGIDKHIYKMLEILGVETQWASEALWTIEQYIQWRQSIYRKYAGLFDLNEKGYSEDTDPIDPMAVSRGWYEIITDLAGFDILKMDLVTEEPLEKVLTFLQIKKEKALKEAQEIRKIRNTKR
tara:strand:+ start:235 stop:891 length:657 start_codon:yes stop_codon:yes gene_type:complete